MQTDIILEPALIRAPRGPGGSGAVRADAPDGYDDDRVMDLVRYLNEFRIGTALLIAGAIRDPDRRGRALELCRERDDRTDFRPFIVVVAAAAAAAAACGVPDPTPI